MTTASYTFTRPRSFSGIACLAVPLVYRVLVLVGLALAAVSLQAQEPIPTLPLVGSSPLLDVDALAESLQTPERAYAFVRDQIAYEPYTGFMKGADGALLTRGANDCDRALLLARLLSAQGVTVKFARGTVSPDTAQALLDQALQRPDALSKVIATLSTLPATADTDTPETKQQREQFQHAAADRRGAFKLDEENALPAIQSLASRVSINKYSANRAHVWVQIDVDGRTVDLDPSQVDLPYGRALAQAESNFDLDSLPDELWHSVSFRIVKETLAAGQLTRQNLLTQTFHSADLVTTGLRVAIMPLVRKKFDGTFRSLILQGDATHEGSSFRVSGEAPTQESAPAVGGLFGGFGGGAEPEEKPAATDPNAPVLARLWIEVQWHAPDSADETVRRMIVDRVEPDGANWKIAAGFANEKAIGVLCAQTWDAAVDVGAVHPLALARTEAAALKTMDPVEQAAADKHPLVSGDLASPTLSPALLGYFFNSALKAHQLSATAEFAHARRFFDRPRVAFLRHGHATGDWAAPGARLRYREGIDLANAPFHFAGGADGAAARLALRSGLFDTVLERYVVTDGGAFNTLPLFFAAANDKVAFVTVDSTAQLAQVDAPPAIKAALAEDVATGRMIVAPAHLVAYRDTHSFGWWSLDPKTGYVIGKMELGGGQSLGEAEEMNEKITEWTEQYVKFMSNVLKCYQDTVVDTLVEQKKDDLGVVTGIDLKHGPDPMPWGSDKMIECLRGAVCDAIKDFLTTKLSSAAISDELKKAETLEADLTRQAIEDGAGKIMGPSSKMCDKLLGGVGK